MIKMSGRETDLLDVLEKGIKSLELKRIRVKSESNMINVTYEPLRPSKAKTRLDVNRFIPDDKLGWLCGFIQSEGTHVLSNYFDVSSKNIDKLGVFMECIKLLGLPLDEWFAKYRLVGNTSRLEEFKESTDIKKS